MFHVVRVAVTFSSLVICLQFAAPVDYWRRTASSIGQGTRRGDCPGRQV